MAVIKVDTELCESYGNCVASADDVFDIGDEGTVVLLQPSVPESDRARVEEAVRKCPVGALRIEDE
jgi:3-phenylpropionate/trans-cinnamate dioxygenase ferredoxin reductase subunit